MAEEDRRQRLKEEIETLANSLQGGGPSNFAESLEAFVDEEARFPNNPEFETGPENRPFIFGGAIEGPAESGTEFIQRLKDSEDPNRRQFGQKLENKFRVSQITSPLREQQSKRQRTRERLSGLVNQLGSLEEQELEQTKERRKALGELSDFADQVDMTTEQGQKATLEFGTSVLNLPQRPVAALIKSEAQREARERKRQQEEKQFQRTLDRTRLNLQSRKTSSLLNKRRHDMRQDKLEQRRDKLEQRRENFVSQFSKPAQEQAKRFRQVQERFASELNDLPKEKQNEILSQGIPSVSQDGEIKQEKLDRLQQLRQQMEEERQKLIQQEKRGQIGDRKDLQKATSEFLKGVRSIGGGDVFTRSEKLEFLKKAKKISEETGVPLKEAARRVGKNAGFYSEFKNTSAEQTAKQLLDKNLSNFEDKVKGVLEEELNILERSDIDEEATAKKFTGLKTGTKKLVGPGSMMDQKFKNVKAAISEFLDRGLPDTFPAEMNNILEENKDNNFGDLFRRNMLETKEAIQNQVSGDSKIRQDLIKFYDEPQKLATQKDRASTRTEFAFSEEMKKLAKAGLITEDELLNPVKLRAMRDFADQVSGGENDTVLENMKRVARKNQSPSHIKTGNQKRTLDGEKVKGASRDDIDSKIRSFLDPANFDSFLDRAINLKDSQFEKLSRYFGEKGQDVASSIDRAKERVRNLVKEELKSKYTDALSNAIDRSLARDTLFGVPGQDGAALRGLRLNDEDYIETNDHLVDTLTKGLIDGSPTGLKSKFVPDDLTEPERIMFRRVFENTSINLLGQLLNDQFRSFKQMKENISSKLDAVRIDSTG